MTATKAGWARSSAEGRTEGDGVTEGEGAVLGMGFLGLLWDLRMVCGGAETEEGFRRVGGAILALLDQTVELVVGLSSSEGGGRSPYKPPSILRQNQIRFVVIYI